ncbi:RstB phage-related integrase [Vibrio aestuarianus]|nr:RstB phage-related integrase [Vibrio aestuarianus]
MGKLTVLVIGCEHSQGLSKANDKPYDFAMVNYLKPNDGWTSQKGSCNAYGLMQEKISMTPSVALLTEFDKLQSKFPLMCDLILNADPTNPQRNIVVDIKPVIKQG